jgi:cytochrome P450 family 4 subfamily V
VELTEKAIGTLPLDSDIELTDFFSRFTLDILGRTLFNYDFRRIDGQNDKYYTAYRTLFELLPTFWGMILFIFPRISSLPLPIKVVRDYLEGIDTLVQFFKDIIKEKRGKEDNSILSNLLSAADKDGLSEDELIANIWIFFVAGHETTASSLVWALNCLRIYPHIQEKIYEEIKRVIGRDRIPTEEDLEKLVYLDAFIQEVLRLHSPVPLLASRIATEDVKYKNMIIPKGTRVGIHFHTLHTNPEYWDEPLKFNPDRFEDDRRKGRNHFLHIPFSAGIRQCIGNNFSLIEQRLFLSRFIQNYRVVDPKQKDPFPEGKYLGLGSNNNVSVRIEKRIC